jgi:hypothetical protein
MPFSSQVVRSDVVGGRPTKGLLALLGALAIFATVLLVGAGGERTSVASAAEGCPNSSFRDGPSSTLPDCRAYEMVSPLDKNGGDIVTRCDIRCNRTSLMQANRDGSKLSYSAFVSFGDAPSSLYSNQYIASRGGGGWSTHSINPPRHETLFSGFPSLVQSFYDLDIQARGLSGDLSTMAWTDGSRPALTPDAVEEVPNLYSRDNLNDTYDWIAELGEVSEGSDPGGPWFPEILNLSETGDHIVFMTPRELTADPVPAGGGELLYDYTGGDVHLVSILPDGTPVRDATAGSYIKGGNETQGGQFVRNALSADGARITWSTATSIYQRIGNSETKHVSEVTSKNEIAEVVITATGGAFKLNLSGAGETAAIPFNATAAEVQAALDALAGVEPGDLAVTGSAGGPYTIAFAGQYEKTNVSLAANGSGLTGPDPKAEVITVQEGPAPARYEGASTDGTEVLYRQAGGTGFENLYRVDVDDQTATLVGQLAIGSGFNGVLGASDDLSRIYFSSGKALAAGATAGSPNLYLDDNGTTEFIATLSRIDFGESVGLNEQGKPEVSGYNMLQLAPERQAVRVTPDGSGLAFQSVASLTGYDNRDVKNNELDVEVFVYDATSDQLTCASCNPSGARPNGKPAVRYNSGEETLIGANDQQRRWTAAFLQTAENQTYYPRDFSDDGNRLFFNAYDALSIEDNNNKQDVYQWEAQGTGTCTEPGGCVSLISTGESSAKSEFVDASANGDVVFFTTSASLAPQDPGLIDIYAAAVGGGFDFVVREAPCEGDACQPLPVAPNDPTPGSASYNGPGNVQAQSAKKKHKKKHHKHGKKKRGKKNQKGKAQSNPPRTASHRSDR